MDVLINSAFLRMPGPHFLVVYAAIAIIAVLIFNILILLEKQDGAIPSMPQRPDPYEIAYLRDGVAGVVGVALYALKRLGAIEMDDKGRLAPVAGGEAPSHPIETAVLAAIGEGVEASQARASWLRSAVEDRCRPLKQRLDNLGLLVTPSFRRRAAVFAVLIGAGLVVLAALKIAVALATGHANVAFLIIELVAALIALGVNLALVVRPTANARGKGYLGRIKLALSGQPEAASHDANAFVNRAALALVGAFGFEILLNGPDAAFAQRMRRASSGDSGSGGDSGGGSCGGGGGCGGCGGGGD